MKQNVVGIIALVAALGSIGFQVMHKTPKIAYADTNVLLDEFTEAIKAKGRFEEAQKEWDKNLKALNDSLMASMDRMKGGFDKASPAEKDRMRSELQKRNDDLQRYTVAVKTMSQDKQKELMEPVVKKMNSFLDIWGKQKGYDLVLGTMAGGNILQANPALNLTTPILRDLNEHYKDFPKASEAPAAKTDTDTIRKSP